MKTQLLLVDGYNMIGAWPELVTLKNQDRLEDAREALLQRLSNYAKYENIRVIVVFDAQLVPGITQNYTKYQLEVVFTEEGETADSFIERTVYELKDSYKTVSVCTSDYAEQIQVLGSGALRVSSRELKVRVERAKLDEKKYYVGFRKGAATKLNRNEFGKHLDGEVADKWEGIRRGKPKLK